MSVLACGHEVLDPTKTHYCDYISLAALEGLKRPFATDPNNARDPLRFDETLFVVAHQVMELMLGEAVASLREAVTRLAADPLSEEFEWGMVLVRRATSWLEAAMAAFGPLKTMKQFKDFRESLKPASGAESLNARRLEILAGIREDTPYVVERERAYTYREFLDRPPGPGENDPKTRWWTEELSELARQPSLWSVLGDQLERLKYQRDASGIEQAFDAAPTAEDAWRYRQAYRLRLLCGEYADLELILKDWRNHHKGAAVREIGNKPGTGHTSGVAYLKSANENFRLFPGLREVLSKQDLGDPKRKRWSIE